MYLEATGLMVVVVVVVAAHQSVETSYLMKRVVNLMDRSFVAPSLNKKGRPC